MDSKNWKINVTGNEVASRPVSLNDAVQYPDTGGANRLPPLKDSSGAGDNTGSG
jgi:hypothetical protein